MKLIFNRLSVYAYILILLFTSCSSDDNSNPLTTNPSIENSAVIDTLSTEAIKQNYTIFLKAMATPDDKIAEALSTIKYDIVFAKVEYKAKDPFGVEKTLSGLVIYPVLPANDKNKTLSVVSIQHGTLTYESKAPSKINPKSLDPIRDIIGIVSASHENGYIVLQPDYFGYGSDEINPHYYELAASLATASRKLIENIPAYTSKQGLSINYNNLYLFGYSEGGGATISTLKSFSENSSNFNNYITVAGAGAYDKLATADYIVQQTTGDSPQFSASYAWVVLTYNSVYKINRDINALYSESVAPEISNYVGNDLIMQTKSIPAAPAEVFNSAFAQNFLNRSDKEFVNAFSDNNVSDFNAKGKVYLVHGEKDTWVPTFNTLHATENFKKRGVDVTETLYPGGTHATTYPVFAKVAISKLE